MAVRITKELALLKKSPVPGIVVHADEANIFNIMLDVAGPIGTPYEGGVFKVKCTLPAKYPHEKPLIAFVTKVYHPNIDENGEACLPIFHNGWAPTTKLSAVFSSITELLQNPNGESAADTKIGIEFCQNHDAFNAKAVQWTKQYAN